MVTFSDNADHQDTVCAGKGRLCQHLAAVRLCKSAAERPGADRLRRVPQAHQPQGMDAVAAHGRDVGGDADGAGHAALRGETSEEAQNLSIAEAMDEMIKWFCILFGNQFTPDEVLDYYPVDRLMHDIAFALMAVQTQTTHVLNEFPTKAAQTSQEETPQV